MILNSLLVIFGLLSAIFLTIGRVMLEYDKRQTGGHFNAVNFITVVCALMVLFGVLGLVRR